MKFFINTWMVYIMKITYAEYAYNGKIINHRPRRSVSIEFGLGKSIMKSSDQNHTNSLCR